MVYNDISQTWIPLRCTQATIAAPSSRPNSFMNHLRTILLIALAEMLSACASTATNCGTGEQLAIQETLYFGTGKTDGQVSALEWEEFLAARVTPLFPRGLTVWPAFGQWQSANGTAVREISYVLTLIHPVDRASDAAIRQIIDNYKSQFAQEAVIKAKSVACVSY